MAIGGHQNGKLVWVEHEGTRIWWNPTTELLCSFCREPFALRPQTLGQVNFTFERLMPDPLQRGEYWYLHKHCAWIDRVLEVPWGWLSLYAVLGRGFMGKGSRPKTQQDIKGRLPLGAYEHLYAQWLPALQGAKQRRLWTPAKKTTFRHSVPAPQAPSARPLPKPKSPRVGKTGEAYLIEAVGPGLIKIGHGASALVRLRQLSTGTPYPLRILRKIPSRDSYGLEQRLQARYEAFKQWNEWYALPAPILKALLEEEFL